MLETCTVVAFGGSSGTVVYATGTEGVKRLTFPTTVVPFGLRPCDHCEYRTRPECATIEGCKVAEDWRAAELAYAGSIEGPRLDPEQLTLFATPPKEE